MRRNDREITDINELLELLKEAKVCRLGLSFKDQPYVVPLNFGYLYEDEQLTLFFHGAKIGQKLDYIKANPKACFEVDFPGALIDGGAVAMKYSMAYTSIIGLGTVVLVEDPKEKRLAFDYLMAHYTNKTFTYTDEMVDATAVFRMDVTSFTGKKRLPTIG